MKSRILRWFAAHRLWWAPSVVLAVIVGLAACAQQVPQVNRWVASIWPTAAAGTGEDLPGQHAEGDADHAGHDHEGHDHAKHADGDEDEHGDGDKAANDHEHDEAAAIKLSKQARGSIGLRLARVELRDFARTITVPGIVVERPGWSTLDVTAPMTGVVTKIHPIQGEAVEPGQPLFEVRLTHEDLLQVQAEFLRTVEELDVIGREVARLERVAAEGAIAGKTLLERKYERQKQEAALRAQRQALLLHGLSTEQGDNIVATRTLLQSLTIRAPAREGGASGAHPRQVQQLKVAKGRHVNAGDTLCTLADYGELYIEGRAFEHDIQAVNRAASESWTVSAALGPKSSGDDQTCMELPILYLDDKVDRQSRAFHFYVMLPNRLLREDTTPDGRRFIYWQFRPGQRTQVRIPVERWKDRIVLPVEAVAQDGAEAYVFEANGDHFDRRPVHVEYRDQEWVVIANDGAIKVGRMVAASAAHQVHLALKAKAGGGVDPHAGHNH